MRNAFWLSYLFLAACPEPDVIHMISPVQKDVTDFKDIYRLFPMEMPLTKEVVMANSEYETEWRAAVSRGDLSTARNALAKMTMNDFTYRMQNDSLRARKNNLLSVNALCQSAAIDGGANAISVYHIYEEYMIRIENAINTADLEEIENNILISYCNLVVESQMGEYSPIVVKAIKYLYAHYDASLTLSGVAKGIHCSESHLSRCFCKETGKTLREYLNEIRIKQAISILESTNYSITEVAASTGFSSYAKFSVEFKKITGTSASKYQKN
ncbi:MAG: helix-turn-helix domain-containing protein [Dorea sp.]